MLEIWPNLEAALTWIDRYGDQDGDGFVEYMRQTSQGLANQGWKDSCDAIFMPMENWPMDLSHFAKFRPMCTRPNTSLLKSL